MLPATLVCDRARQRVWHRLGARVAVNSSQAINEQESETRIETE